MTDAQPRETREEAVERENQEFLALQRETGLRGTPSGDQRCDNCRYYVAEYKKIGYCNHPGLELLVGAGWWCRWWDVRE